MSSKSNIQILRKLLVPYLKIKSNILNYQNKYPLEWNEFVSNCWWWWIDSEDDLIQLGDDRETKKMITIGIGCNVGNFKIKYGKVEYEFYNLDTFTTPIYRLRADWGKMNLTSEILNCPFFKKVQIITGTKWCSKTIKVQ